MIFCFCIGLLLNNYWRVKLYTLVCGYKIADGCRIGNCFINVKNLCMSEGSSIGHFSFVRNVEFVTLHSYSKIGSFNWIYGFVIEGSKHFVNELTRKSSLTLKMHSSVTSRHTIDCTNLVEIGEFSTIAGFYTQILTHGIDISHNIQSSKPVIIGSYCMVGSGSIITKGSVLPKGTILAAGSVFRGSPSDEYCLYSGVPAECVKRLDENSKYYLRDKGSVD